MAVMFVVVTHAGAGLLPLNGLRAPDAVLTAAYFGVELFFVLSGFLIGGLLVEVVEVDPSPRAWFAFMLRRWLRTLPLYFAWLLLLPLLIPAPPALRWHQWHYAAMLQNLAWPMPADRWFNESWSLAIEEWFYLLFSLVLIAATAASRRRGVATCAVIGAFIVVPAVARVMLVPHFGMASYHIAALRLDAIAYGVALAWLHRRRSRLFQHPHAVLMAGLALVGVLWAQEMRGPWLPLGPLTWLNLKLVLTSVALCLVLAGLVQLRPRLGPLAPVVCGGARISYGIYIMHLALFEAMIGLAERHHFGNAVGSVAALVLSFTLPALSFRYFEGPLLALRPPQFKRRAGLPAPLGRPGIGAVLPSGEMARSQGSGSVTH